MTKALVAIFGYGFIFAAFPLSADEPGFRLLHGELVKKWPKGRAVNIVFHGHSLPAGYHKTLEVSPFESYPHLFHAKPRDRHPYPLNDLRDPLDWLVGDWRSIIHPSKRNGAPVVFIPPTGNSSADLANPADPLRPRTDLIRSLAKDDRIPLAYISASLLAKPAADTSQDQRLGQLNHSNARGHQIATNTMFSTHTNPEPSP